MNKERINWIDIAKGFCIIMVVMMHSVYGVEKYTSQSSFFSAIIAYAGPFRMPDFFLLSGLFIGRVIHRDWHTSIDKRVWYFIYFYALWSGIQVLVRNSGLVLSADALGLTKIYLMTFVTPDSTLWFIHMLPIMFVVTKLLRNVPVWLVFPAAAALQIAHVPTGWLVADEFAARFVYFYTGYAFAAHVFRFADYVATHRASTALAVLVWAIWNGIAVKAGVSALPVISLVLGLAGAAGVVAAAVLISSYRWSEVLRYAGEHSLSIYLAFFLPMAATRTLLLKVDAFDNINIVAAVVTLAAIGVPLLMRALAVRTPLRFLFERPARLTLTRLWRPKAIPAE